MKKFCFCALLFFLPNVSLAADPQIAELVNTIKTSTDTVACLMAFAKLSELSGNGHSPSEKENYGAILNILGTDAEALPKLLQAMKAQQRARGVVAPSALFVVADLASADPRKLAKEAKSAAVQMTYLFLQEGSLVEKTIAGSAVLALKAGWREKFELDMGKGFDKAIEVATEAVAGATQGGSFESRVQNFKVLLVGRAFHLQWAYMIVEIFAEWNKLSEIDKGQLLIEFDNLAEDLFLLHAPEDYVSPLGISAARISGQEEPFAAIMLKAVYEGMDRVKAKETSTLISDMFEAFGQRFRGVCRLSELGRKIAAGNSGSSP